MPRKSIHISQLSSRCVTRSRGKEAGEKLQKYLESGPVEIDLCDVEIMSMSFLDGLITQLLASANTDMIIFRIDDPMVRDKLARIAEIRSACLFHRTNTGKVRRVVPKTPVSYKTTSATTKTLNRDGVGSTTPVVLLT